jgi:hypothetical protein
MRASMFSTTPRPWLISFSLDGNTVKLLSILVSIGVLLAYAAQAEPDARFDGIWVGVETCTPSSALKPDQQKSIPRPRNTTIAIAKSGTMVGIIGGACPGRYERVRRTGNTLTFGVSDCNLSVTLSPDGKTLTEQGNCHYATMYTLSLVNGRSWPVTWVPLTLSGTLHRSK